MECSEARELLGAYIDREIGGREALEVQRHLDACAACRAQRDACASLREAVGEERRGTARRTHLSVACSRRFRHARTRERQATVGSWRWLALGSALASVMAIAWSAVSS